MGFAEDVIEASCIANLAERQRALLGACMAPKEIREAEDRLAAFEAQHGDIWIYLANLESENAQLEEQLEDARRGRPSGRSVLGPVTELLRGGRH